MLLSCVTLYTFSSAKRQIEQINICTVCPFEIVFYAKHETYNIAAYIEITGFQTRLRISGMDINKRPPSRTVPTAKNNAQLVSGYLAQLKEENKQ